MDCVKVETEIIWSLVRNYRNYSAPGKVLPMKTSQNSLTAKNHVPA
jgi:hypothetical protein